MVFCACNPDSCNGRPMGSCLTEWRQAGDPQILIFYADMIIRFYADNGYFRVGPHVDSEILHAVHARVNDLNAYTLHARALTPGLC